MIPFNKPVPVGREKEYLSQVVDSCYLSGDGPFTKKCHTWIENRFCAQKALLTTSGTTALNMAMALCDLHQGDEVIIPSFTFSSTATAPVMMGAKIVFVDIRPDTMNIEATLVEKAITERTKAIIVMHYAGVACEMDIIMDIAKKHHLMVVEDAAQAVMSKYKGKALGTIGDFGCYSFHETKNYSMGEGGALIINNPAYNERAEIYREKGTDRSKFYRGQVDKYTWVDKGDSCLPSELNAAYLWAQLEKADDIYADRMNTWKKYYTALEALEQRGLIERPVIPGGCEHNAHMFYIKTKDLAERTKLIRFLKEKGVDAVFHYMPLHSSPAGRRFGYFSGEDNYTTKESERLLRLPLFYGLQDREIKTVVDSVYEYFEGLDNDRALNCDKYALCMQ